MPTGDSDRATALLRDVLLERRAAAARRLLDSEAGLAAVADARTASTADDEHDPEGATLAVEWSRLEGQRMDATVEIREIAAAFDRLGDPDFGVCIRCGRDIPVERLLVRPTTTMCVPCAARVR